MDMVTNMTMISFAGKVGIHTSFHPILLKDLDQGRGLVVLLHGVPGVGKTSTAGQLDSPMGSWPCY